MALQQSMNIDTDRNGVFRLQYDNGVYTNVPFNDQDKLVNTRVRGIIESDADIWIATYGEGLYAYNGNSLTRLTIPVKSDVSYFTSIHKDMFGDIWLGTWGSGVLHYTHSVFKIYNRRNGLNDDLITCITSDRHGNTWFGTYTSGLIFFGGGQFTALTIKDGMPDNHICGITTDNAGNMWFVTPGGLTMYD